MTISDTILNQIHDQANRPDPYPLYRQLLEEPVSWQETPDGEGTFVVARHRDVVAVFQDPRLSSDARKKPGAGVPADAPTPMFQQVDPPEHDEMRAMTMEHFGPPHRPDYIDGLRTTIDRTTADLLDELADRREVDLVDEFAYQLPVRLICRILGVPPEDEPRFSAWVAKSLGDPADSPEVAAEKAVAQGQLAHYMGELVHQRRGDPQDDMLSHMAADRRWDEGALVQTSMALLVAGHETTVNLIANGIVTLIRKPDVADQVRNRPEQIVPMVEELLRYEPPAQMVPNRHALDDITVDGVTIPRHAPVTLAIAAANRDPDRFPDPDRFIPTRQDNTHLGFGNGVHYCFGAPLARLEAQAALGAFLQRVRNPQLVDAPRYGANATLRGPVEIRVSLDGVRDDAGRSGTASRGVRIP